LNLWYDHGRVHALDDISMELYPGEVLAFIGPSGCGKSTMLKVFNRMHDMDRGVRITGRITLDGGGHQRARGRPAASASPLRLGRAEAEPVSHEHLAERVLRAAHPRADAGRRRDWRRMWRIACAARICGTR
jgi:ABC-type glutathione transport system ATPase component